MSDIIKIAAIAVTSALCAVVIKKQTPEVGTVLALAGGAVILSFAIASIGSVTAFMSTLADTAGLSPAVLTPVFKVAGIAIISHTTAEVCKDAKEGGLASFVETASAALALLVTLPLLKTVLSMITGLI